VVLQILSLCFYAFFQNGRVARDGFMLLPIAFLVYLPTLLLAFLVSSGCCSCVLWQTLQQCSRWLDEGSRQCRNTEQVAVASACLQEQAAVLQMNG
jgi:hypothetical protein